MVVRYEESPFAFVFCPVGAIRSFATEVPSVVQQLAKITNRRIVFRKIPEHAYKELIRLDHARDLPVAEIVDSRDIPEDVYPQTTIDVSAAHACRGTYFMKIRNKIKQFVELCNPIVKELIPSRSRDVFTLVEKWNSDLRSHFERGGEARPGLDVIDGRAMTIFSEVFATRVDYDRYFARILYVREDPVGFVFAGRTSSKSAALYSSISLTAHIGASEYLLRCLLADLTRAGITNLNLGEAETAGLFRFKSKFKAINFRTGYDIEIGG